MKDEAELKLNKGDTFIKNLKRHWGLYALLILPLVYIIIFQYIPMYGAQIAFRDFIPTMGITGSKWIGILNFKRFFKSYVFWRLIKNTIGISFYWLIASFPFPIILAIGINEVRNIFFKKTMQMITYAPYFISMVVMVSIIIQVLSPHTGVINNMLQSMGVQPINFMGKPEFFKSIYVWSGIWQVTGYSCIIYIAALTGIDPTLYEAAIVDGASKFKRILYIDLPSILPTAVILLILASGSIMNVGFEKVYLMQNDMNISASEVISTYVYKVGLINGDYSFATAIGLFNSLVNLIIIFTVNKIAQKIGSTSLW